MKLSYKLEIAAILITILSACGSADKSSSITLYNNSNTAYLDEPAIISRAELANKVDHIPDNKLPLVKTEDDSTVFSQVDDLDGNGNWDELALLVNIPANSQKVYNLSFVDSSNYPEFPERTSVRMGVKQDSGIHAVTKLTLHADELPVVRKFQMDGPAWENDKVGFRHYIDGRNARDLYGKKSSKIALDDVGISEEGEVVDNYHTMRDWGRDILSVGNSLGLGGLAILKDGQPVRLGVTMDAKQNNIDSTTYQLISEGPVRTIFELKYEGWDVRGSKYNLINTVTIWGGQYWYQSEVELTSPAANADTLIVGMVNSNNDEPLMTLDKTTEQLIALATYDRQTYEKEQLLGMALLLPKPLYAGYQKTPDEGPGITTSFNARIILNDQKKFTYYALAGWELADEQFGDREKFKNFLITEMNQLATPVRSK